MFHNFSRLINFLSDYRLLITSRDYLKKMPQKSFKVNDEYAKISEIIPGLFISGVSGLTLENIKKYQISMIINATTEVFC